MNLDDCSYAYRVLLETDKLYFSLGAKRSSRSGLDLLYLPGCLESPSGSVVWGVDRSADAVRLSRMLACAEAELSALGGHMMRVYVENPIPYSIAEAFQQAGYQSRVEVALLADVDRILEGGGACSPCTFLRVESEAHWRLKEALHATEGEQPDGYPADPSDWVGLERTKCATGGMACYLVLQEAEPVATVGLMLDRGVARLKNLFVSPAARKAGIGLTTIRLLAAQARALGYRQFGCFALERGNAIRVYERAGLRPVAAATEFSRPLDATQSM